MEGALFISTRPPIPISSTSVKSRFYPSNSRIYTSMTRSRTLCRVGGGNNSSSESESKAALDAFFLGKAVAEAINERISSNVGEFLSIIGQWQAEQQKQVQEFQEEVIQRAKKEKEKAAAEALGTSSAPAIRPPPSNSGDSDPFGDMLNGQ